MFTVFLLKMFLNAEDCGEKVHGVLILQYMTRRSQSSDCLGRNETLKHHSLLCSYLRIPTAPATSLTMQTVGLAAALCTFFRRGSAFWLYLVKMSLVE